MKNVLLSLGLDEQDDLTIHILPDDPTVDVGLIPSNRLLDVVKEELGKEESEANITKVISLISDHQNLSEETEEPEKEEKEE